MNSPKYNRILHQSVPDYLSTIRDKVAKFGRKALSPYEEPRSLVLGFKCEDEIHLIGLNHIRAYYNIERKLPNIPGLVVIRNNKSPTVSDDDGIAMFANDCREALKEP